ncbi:MAG: 2-hydroxyacid dehydrogenase [Nocardioidaceae bacterium]
MTRPEETGPSPRPLVLMPGPMHDTVVSGCERQFDVLRLWESSDPEAVLDDRATEVWGIATVGHRPVDDELLGRLPNLQIVANFGVGYDTVDAEAAAKRGVVVTNTPGVLDNEVADTAMGLLLMTARELPQAERYLRAGLWRERPYPLTRGTLAGRTLGIVGLGRIGEAIARRALAFGIDVVYHNRRKKPESGYRYYADVLTMAQDVDTLLVATPGGGSTRHLVDGSVLEALGPDGILVNVARGSVVDEQALISALQAGTILGAGLDVYANEPDVPADLLAAQNAVLMPHVGSASVATRRAMGELVVANLQSWFERGHAVTPVPESASVLEPEQNTFPGLSTPRGSNTSRS